MKDKRFDVPGMNIINCRDRGTSFLHKEGNSQKLQQFWGPTQEWPPFERAGGESSSRRHSDEDSRPLASPAENEESSLHTARRGYGGPFCFLYGSSYGACQRSQPAADAAAGRHLRTDRTGFR